MAPARKSKTVNKRYSSKYELSPVKEAGNSSKSNPKKKLFDKLGSLWSKAEIERFYKAYRAYGKDWKKVASAVRNRSTEMVEAFYSMNRAYLSLPDGVASVVGLIAMMTDHYSVLGGGDVERENNEPSKVPRQTQKIKRVKAHFGSSKEDDFLPQSVASSQGCLPLLEGIDFNGVKRHAVRRRTPRVPISYSYRRDDIESYDPPKKRVKKSEADDNDNEHVTAVTLTGALQRESSLQKHYNKAECRKSAPLQSFDHMLIESETTKAKHHSSSYERRVALRFWGEEPVIGTYRRGTGPMVSMEGAATGEVHRKGKQIFRKKVKVDEIMNNLSDDSGEAHSGAEEGITDTVQGKVDMEIFGAKNKLSPGTQRKKNKNIVLGDESDSLYALLTLANLSTSMLPTSTVESESSAKLKEDKTTCETEEKSSASEAASVGHHSDKTKHLRRKEKVLNLITEAEDGTSRKSKVGRYSVTVDNVVSEPKQQPEPINNSKKSKSKSFSTSQISNLEAPIDSPFIQSFDNEDITEEVNKSINTSKCSAESSVQSRQWKPFRVPEDSPTDNDPKIAETDQVVSTLQIPTEPKHVSLPNKHQSRRKMNLKRALVSRDINSPKYTLENQPNRHSLSQDSLKENLSSCLSSSLARRWCSFEWFYSAIDYTWFAKKEFVEYLNHVGLGHIPQLTRVEWGVIRSSLGKPRRFSQRFLYEEREKLKQYQESVRQHYTQLRRGTMEGIPTDLACPLSVGQQVIAIHPKTREVNDGKILCVEHDSCRVRFDNPELGVELVMDIDCMPLNPLENFPETLRKQNLSFDKFPVTSNEYQVNGHSDFGRSGVYTPSVHPDNATYAANMLANPIKVDASRNILNAKTADPDVVSAHQTANYQPLTMAHIQGREADIQVMSELNRALDKKEAVLMELRKTNDVLENRNGGSCLKGSEPFKKHIATVLVQLNKANGQVSSALHNLRQHNSYPANPISPQQKPPPNSNFIGGLASSIYSSLVSQESDSFAGEIVEGSRLKAGSMVDAAIKAMSSTKDDEDAFMRIVEALDSIDKPPFTPDIRMPLIKSTEPENGSISYQKHLVSVLPQKNEQVPSELITSCVATLLMIQTCTERQYPPADVAQIIDAAVTSLHPWSTENLRVYREIQRCMGRIKSQILALIPT